MDMTLPPVLVSSALKQAGPSPQPSIFFLRSPSDNENISLYSFNDLPQGTTFDNSTMFSFVYNAPSRGIFCVLSAAKQNISHCLGLLMGMLGLKYRAYQTS